MVTNIKAPDIIGAYESGQRARALRIQEEKLKLEIEREKQKAAFVQKVRDAQSRVVEAHNNIRKAQEANDEKQFNMETKKYEAAMSDLNTLNPELAAQQQEVRLKFQKEMEKNLEIGEKQRKQNTEKSLAGAEFMQNFLPSVIQETPVGKVIDPMAMLRVTSQARQALENGMIGQEQYQKIYALNKRSEEIAKLGAQGADENTVLAKVNVLANDVIRTVGTAGKVIETFGDPETMDNLGTMAKEIGVSAAIETGDPKASNFEYLLKTYPELAKQKLKEYKSEKIKRAAATAPSFQVDIDTGQITQELEKGSKVKIQDKLIENQQLLGNLESIESLADEQYFTLIGRVENNISSLIADVDPDLLSGDKTYNLQTRKMLNNEVEQFFNAYRKLITGAAAPMEELKQLRKTMLNMDLSWPEFQASFKQLQQKIARSTRLYRKILREGVNISPEQAAKKMNEYWANGLDAKSKDDIKHRRGQLIDGGISQENQIKILLKEGYLTRSQADIALDKLDEFKRNR